MPTIQEKVERELGFRVGPRGIEHLEFEEIKAVNEDRIIMVKHNVRAVSPVLHHKGIVALWELALKAYKEAELKRREKEFWSHKAFTETEELRRVQDQHAQEMAHLRAQLDAATTRAESAELELGERASWKAAPSESHG